MDWFLSKITTARSMLFAAMAACSFSATLAFSAASAFACS